jgi:hypothetical protein
VHARMHPLLQWMCYPHFDGLHRKRSLLQIHVVHVHAMSLYSTSSIADCAKLWHSNFGHRLFTRITMPLFLLSRRAISLFMGDVRFSHQVTAKPATSAAGGMRRPAPGKGRQF